MKYFTNSHSLFFYILYSDSLLYSEILKLALQNYYKKILISIIQQLNLLCVSKYRNKQLVGIYKIRVLTVFFLKISFLVLYTFQNLL